MAAIKRTAQSVNPLVIRKNKIHQKIADLNLELEEIESCINGWENAIISMTGGLKSEDLVKKTVITSYNDDGSVKLDKDGKPIKTTKYEANLDVLQYNEDTRDYTILEPEKEEEPCSILENF